MKIYRLDDAIIVDTASPEEANLLDMWEEGIKEDIVLRAIRFAEEWEEQNLDSANCLREFVIDMTRE